MNTSALKVNGELAAQIKEFKLPPDFPLYEEAFPSLNPVDIFRCFITEELSKITGVDKKLIYPSLAWTNTLDKGDLTLATPRLRIKGGTPAEQASKWVSAVWDNYPYIASP
jgi:arginyl-tRNA synthetase